MLTRSPDFVLLHPGSRSLLQARTLWCPLEQRPPRSLCPLRCATTSGSSKTCPAARALPSTAHPGETLCSRDQIWGKTQISSLTNGQALCFLLQLVMLKRLMLYIVAVVNVFIKFAASQKVQKLGGGWNRGIAVKKRKRKKDFAGRLSQHDAGLV